MAMPERGIVEYFGSNGESYKCGYCKQEKPSCSDFGKFRHGMWGHKLSPDNYQDLINRGWRRSGCYVYKPIMNRTCCPAYTIKCEALRFKATRSQKRVINCMNHFLACGDMKSTRKSTVPMDLCRGAESTIPDHNLATIDAMSCDYATSDKKVTSVVGNRPTKENLSMEVEGVRSLEKTTEGHRIVKAKQKRIERKIRRVMKKYNCDENRAKTIVKQEREKLLKEREVTLEDRLARACIPGKEPKHTLQIKFVSTSLKSELSEIHKLSHKVYEKYQVKIHGDEPEKVSFKQYRRFLIDSPIIRTELNGTSEASDQIPKHYGSYHMQYWLDDEKMIAVGVIDILPDSISSVYLFYDPEYDFLTLGTYSALREIELVRKLSRRNSTLNSYYMGFYIHNCPKMTYKGKFWPSFLLCPEVFNWHPIEKCVGKLDVSKYSRLEEDSSAVDELGREISDEHVIILYKSELMTWWGYKKSVGNLSDDREEVETYAKLVGNKCCDQMILYRESVQAKIARNA